MAQHQDRAQGRDNDESHSYGDFAAKYALRMRVTPVDRNPSMPEWRDADHYRLTLTRDGKRMQLHYSKGYGHNGRHPEIGEVLETLALDSSYADDSFEEFCANLGYDADSRKAERIFRQCQRMVKSLTNLLGADGLAQLREVTP